MLDDRLRRETFLMTKRLATYLADGIYDLLEDWANQERRSISSLAAFLLEKAVREHQEQIQKQPRHLISSRSVECSMCDRFTSSSKVREA